MRGARGVTCCEPCPQAWCRGCDASVLKPRHVSEPCQPSSPGMGNNHYGLQLQVCYAGVGGRGCTGGGGSTFVTAPRAARLLHVEHKHCMTAFLSVCQVRTSFNLTRAWADDTALATTPSKRRKATLKVCFEMFQVTRASENTHLLFLKLQVSMLQVFLCSRRSLRPVQDAQSVVGNHTGGRWAMLPDLQVYLPVSAETCAHGIRGLIGLES